MNGNDRMEVECQTDVIYAIHVYIPPQTLAELPVRICAEVLDCTETELDVGFWVGTASGPIRMHLIRQKVPHNGNATPEGLAIAVTDHINNDPDFQENFKTYITELNETLVDLFSDTPQEGGGCAQ